MRQVLYLRRPSTGSHFRTVSRSTTAGTVQWASCITVKFLRPQRAPLRPSVRGGPTWFTDIFNPFPTDRTRFFQPSKPCKSRV